MSQKLESGKSDGDDKYHKAAVENDILIKFLYKSQQFNYALATVVIMITLMILKMEYAEAGPYRGELLLAAFFSIPLTCLLSCVFIHRGIGVSSVLFSQIILLYIGFMIGFESSLQIKLFKDILNKDH